MDYRALAKKISAGDHKAFRSLFDVVYDSLVAYITTFTLDRENAKDIAQQCFANLWDKRKELNEVLSLRSYLFSMAHNLYIDQYRKEQSKSRLYDQLKIEALSKRINEPEVTTNERAKKLTALVERLPPKCRQILLLNKKEGKKYQEIAEILGISVKTVESQMRIAYQKIREGFNSSHFLFLLYKFTSSPKVTDNILPFPKSKKPLIP